MPPTGIARKRGKKALSYTLTDVELGSIRGAVEALEAVRKKHSISYEDLLGLVVGGRDRVPVTIFSRKLSSLEAIARYLKDELCLSHHKIAELLGRDERNIWHSYHDSLKKHPEALAAGPAQFFIPLKIFAEKKFSILESIVVHLRHEYSLSYRQISALVQRNEKTVWTVYSRAKKRMKNKQYEQ